MDAIRHLKVPTEPGRAPKSEEERAACLGPEGSAEHVSRVLGMLSGRWKLPILFRLFADTTLRSSQLLRDISGISQKMLTQHLRQLEQDGLVRRQDFGERPPRVEYSLTRSGHDLLPILIAIREFSRDYPGDGG